RVIGIHFLPTLSNFSQLSTLNPEIARLIYSEGEAKISSGTWFIGSVEDTGIYSHLLRITSPHFGKQNREQTQVFIGQAVLKQKAQQQTKSITITDDSALSIGFTTQHLQVLGDSTLNIGVTLNSILVFSRALAIVRNANYIRCAKEGTAVAINSFIKDDDGNPIYYVPNIPLITQPDQQIHLRATRTNNPVTINLSIRDNQILDVLLPKPQNIQYSNTSITNGAR
ncbi:MAG TPA: hypothetical protein PLX79_00425, partial [Candidatus Dojkabacteria bacterium]|nr:hypothetical protein [Candidatus Dojkabacteria bacterium]